MSIQHKDLASGRWAQLSLVEQMANVGGEVQRALNWKAKNNPVYCQLAVDRAFELIDLSLAAASGFPRLKELARLREALVDYFCGANEFGSSEVLWQKYFSAFTYAVRISH